MIRLLRENKTVQNFTWLVINHSANVLAPIVLFPFLIHAAGMESFATFSVMIAVSNIAIIVVDYGFQVTGVKDALEADNEEKTSRLISAIFFTKFFLFLIASLLLLPIIMLGLNSPSYLHIYFGVLLALLGTTFNVVWFLLAKNQVYLIAIPNVIVRISMVLISIFTITSADNFYLIYYYWGLAFFLFGFISFLIVKWKYAFRISRVSIATMLVEIKKGWAIFITNLNIIFYTQVPLLTLSFYFGNTSVIVGEYSIAEKMIMLFRQVLSVFSQSFYPEVCARAKAGHQHLKALFSRVMPPMLWGAFALAILLSVAAHPIILLATGALHEPAILVLRILAWLPLITAINVPFYQTILLYEKKGVQTIAFVSASLIAFFSCIFLAKTFSAGGAAIAALITEGFIAVAMMYFVERSPHALLKKSTT